MDIIKTFTRVKVTFLAIINELFEQATSLLCTKTDAVITDIKLLKTIK